MNFAAPVLNFSLHRSRGVRGGRDGVKMQNIESLQEILPYVRTFLGKTFVIKLGGEVCRQTNLKELAPQLSLIHHIGIKVVIVHGGGPQMDEVCDKLNIERKVVHGRRITDADTLTAAKMVYAGLLSTDIVSALRGVGASAIGLSGVDARLIEAKRRLPVSMELTPGRVETIDFENVGDIQKVNISVIERMLADGIIPVISSLAADDLGNVLNVNADTIASRLAQELKAEKLIVLTNVPGVLRNLEDRSSLVSYADVDELEGMISKRAINGGMLPKVQTCIEAVRGGVGRTHIIDGTKPAALLLELFVNEGCGTMIVSKRERLNYEEYEAE